MTEPIAPPLSDLLLTDARASFRLANSAGVSLIRYLMGKQLAQPVAESIAATWAEVVLEPAGLSHDLLQGAQRGEPSFIQMVLRFGSKPVTLEYEALVQPCAFYMEVRGTAYPAWDATLKTRICSMLAIHPFAATRAHRGLHELTAVGDDEHPTERRPTRGAFAPVGVHVEEF